MRHLSERVDARVSAARAADFHFGFEGGFRGADDFALHRTGVLLHLPTTIARAVVFDFQFPSLHGNSLTQKREKSMKKLNHQTRKSHETKRMLLTGSFVGVFRGY